MHASSRLAPLLVFMLVVSAIASPAAAQVQQQFIGRPIADIRIEVAGQRTSEAELRDVLETRVGEPLAMTAVRETLIHLMALSRFETVEVSAEPDPRGVVLVYRLVPVRTVHSIVFLGRLGLDEGVLRAEVTDRYGKTPPLGRADDMARTLEGLYRDHGFSRPRVTPRLNVSGVTRVALAFDIDAGQRARISSIKFEGDGKLTEREVLARLGVKAGVEYDPADVNRRASDYATALHGRGYYAAAVEATPRFIADGVELDVAATRGRKITVAFAGDPIPPEKADELAPLKAEKTVDEDLLEDWSSNIVRYLQDLGYGDAEAPFRRVTSDQEERIVFDVRQGPRHLIDGIDVVGNQAMARESIVQWLGVLPGQALVQRRIQSGVDAIASHYVAAGFMAAKVQPILKVRSSTGAEVRTDVVLQVTEGPKTVISSLRYFVNGTEVPPNDLPVTKLSAKPGGPFYLPVLTTDRDEILLGYLNRGYETASVTLPEPAQMMTADRARADVRYNITTGPQYFVDHILLVGNSRTKAETIRNELQFKSGDPLSLEKLALSQQRLSSLGLFRRVRVTELQQGDTRRDVLVIVDEAPATSIAYGGGVEVARRLRRDPSGLAVPAYELAPRGLFEVGRRNLWGGNRSINFTSSAAVRPNSTNLVGTGLTEYRVLGTYREPRIFSGAFDLLVTGGVEQTVRTSYAFNRRSVYAQVAHRLSPTLSLYGQYSIERTHVFNEQVSEEEQSQIDRLFPQVRISRFTGTIARDTRREDPFDPDSGMLASVEGSLAPRALGSEVGFAKTQAQAFIYRRLPGKHRSVFAGGVRLGLAAGFERTTATGALVRDVPISERFFSGNSVRGFVADRLGRPGTLTPEGFPTGGNGLLVFNLELRTAVFKDLEAVGFVDAGNVFLKASDVDPTLIRPGVGFGFRYKSPLGPIRLDVGFNPNRQRYGNGTLEPLTSVYFGLGQAF